MPDINFLSQLTNLIIGATLTGRLHYDATPRHAAINRDCHAVNWRNNAFLRVLLQHAVYGSARGS